MATKYTPGGQFTVDGKTYTTASGSGYDAVLVQPGALPAPTPTGYSKDAQGNVYTSGGQHITLDQFHAAGLNIDHIPLGPAPASSSNNNQGTADTTGWTRDASGTVLDASGNHITYESLQKGADGKPLVNLENLPLRPVADANADADIISDTSEQQSEVKTQNQKLQEQLAALGIEPPEDKVSPLIEEVLKGLRDRQKELDKREAEDTANIEKGFSTAKEELEMSQTEAYDRASGRVRIGGFIVKSEIEDLERMQRGFRLEMAGLEGSKATALQQATRAYQDQDYELAQAQLELAQGLEEQTYQRKNDYFNNILKLQASQKPVIDMDEVSQEYALSQMSKYPSAFTDLEPADFQNISLSEINRRVIGSKEYKLDMQNQARLAGGAGTGSGVSNQTIDNERALSSQFKSEPIVKNYNEILAKKLSVDQIIQSGVGGPGDLAVVYEFMKGLDPTSVVRETEYATAAKSGNIFLGAMTKFNGYFKESGGFLPDNVKNAFASIVNSKLQIQQRLYDNVASEYSGIAARQGLDPNNVVINYSAGSVNLIDNYIDSQLPPNEPEQPAQPTSWWSGVSSWLFGK